VIYVALEYRQLVMAGGGGGSKLKDSGGVGTRWEKRQEGMDRSSTLCEWESKIHTLDNDWKG